MNAPFTPPTAAYVSTLVDQALAAAREAVDPVRQRAHAAALAIVEAGARETAQTIIALRRRDVEEGAQIMLLPGQQWRITKALYPGRNPALWPIAGMPATECLSDCARMIAAQEAQRDAGLWAYDAARLVTLRQAEAALLSIITGDDAPNAPEAA